MDENLHCSGSYLVKIHDNTVPFRMIAFTMLFYELS